MPRVSLHSTGSLAAIALCGAWLALSSGSTSRALEPIRYDRDIRPILSDRCFLCHGPDAAKRRADLRLDHSESAIADRGGYAAIAPGDVEQSELWHRITHEDPDERMPPAESNKRPLSSEERELVRRWIAEGAAYEPHWAFVSPVRPAVPSVEHDSWARSPIDRFLLANLEKRGIEPSPPALREAQLRRLFLDLTGLPPTPEELDAFLSDTRPDAYEKWVERIFREEPYRSRYAERMTAPWLDAARYADTCGIHTDAGRQMWLWRDWVLAAFRDNMPFDRFLTEQLAGDLLPDATEAQRIASGFNRNHVTTDEGGAIPAEYLVEYAVDRAATTGSVFLGMTFGCARCHDHKFDPVSQEDFYRFYSFFNSVDEPGLYSQLPDSKRAFEPFLEVPTDAQRAELAELAEHLAAERVGLDAPDPEEDGARDAFFADALRRGGVAWSDARVVAARSTEGATLAVQPDGSVLASGPTPERDDHVITIATDATDLRLVAIEALTDPSLLLGRVGRAFNGNAVLTGVSAEVVSRADPSQRRALRFTWVWADHEQPDGDFRAVNVLDDTDELGWAVDAHRVEGGRALLLLAREPFGFTGGSELELTLQYRSVYAEHALGRVRVALGRIDDEGLALLPAAASGWYLVGPFPGAARDTLYATPFGPETDAVLDLARNFGNGNQFWHFDASLQDERTNVDLPKGVGATFVGRRLFVPSPRKLALSLGSDDGFRLFLDGREVASKQVDRSVAADQDQAELELTAGTHAIVFEIVNTGGDGGFYWKAQRRAEELTGALAAALLPERARTGALATRMDRAWRTTFSPGYRERTERIAKLDKRAADVRAAVPQTMVMRELAAPRDTFVLVRGQYDHPDEGRRVERGVPAALGGMPADAPRDRRGLAQWMLAPENPLVARVAVNRTWELLFGTGLVRTSEDFGMQGEWPSHPELLDWLAVEFRDSGWDVQHLLRTLVTSSTYRQSSRARPEVRELDPEDRWLAWFPRRRLSAEQIRDQALYVSDLLVEELGGPSVKPYQPAGLWQEVAMPASNTRIFERGDGADLWRRSLYTYWKRASPPPSLMTFDMPTRESCTVRRPSTNTPLQALVLWNDEQFVEAARALAERTLLEPGGDREKLASMLRRCTARAPDGEELELLAQALEEFRARYRSAPLDAACLIGVGERQRVLAVDDAELAAWTMLASSLFDLDATLCQG